ncbi:hypothetical protein CCP3SC15_610019 [Gammaproteobacteria bacterium]
MAILHGRSLVRDMGQFVIKYKDAQEQKILDAFATIWPIPEVGGVPQFTKAQWVKKHLKGFVTQAVRRERGEQIKLRLQQEILETGESDLFEGDL